jgi:hypothetical protein
MSIDFAKVNCFSLQAARKSSASRGARMAKRYPCTHCLKSTARLHPILDMPLCRLCQSARQDVYRYITKSRALDEYRLKADDLAQLQFHEVDNPYYKISPSMKLYLLRQIEQISMQKWGGEEPYIVTLKDFTPDYLNWLQEDPARVSSLTPEKFQYLIADRLERWGLDVQLVGDIYRKDGGIDIIAHPRSGPPFLVAVQVKHHRTSTPTKVGSIRDFHGSLTSNGSPFHIGLVVTNTNFTADARWFADQNSKLIRLRDLPHLRRWLRDEFDNEFEWREIPTRVILAPGVEIEIPRKGLFVPKSLK